VLKQTLHRTPAGHPALLDDGPVALLLAVLAAVLRRRNMPSSERRRVEHCGQLILREQKYSVPSSAINTRPPRQWNRVSGPAALMARMNRGANAAGGAPSSIRRM
jgi:hypothetical protein